MILYSIKQLEWKQYGDGFIARTAFGNYIVYIDLSGEIMLEVTFGKLQGLHDEPSIKEAKAAAQKHFESLLAPCLDEVHIEPSMGIITV